MSLVQTTRVKDVSKQEWDNPSNAEATFFQKNEDAKIFENHLNPVMLVYIDGPPWALSDESHVSVIFHFFHFVMAKLATSW